MNRKQRETEIELLSKECDEEVERLRGEAINCYDRIEELRKKQIEEYHEYNRILKEIIDVKNSYGASIRKLKERKFHLTTKKR